MKIKVIDNLGKDVTYDREWYINTDGEIFYYTGDPDGPLYVVDNDYTWEVVDAEPAISNWLREYLNTKPQEVFEVNYPSCCDGCSNNPKNGGSGICNCTLPYMENPTLYATNSSIDDCCMTATTSSGAYIFGKEKSDADKQPKADANRIAEAIERTKKYVKDAE